MGEDWLSKHSGITSFSLLSPQQGLIGKGVTHLLVSEPRSTRNDRTSQRCPFEGQADGQGGFSLGRLPGRLGEGGGSLKSIRGKGSMPDTKG